MFKRLAFPTMVLGIALALLSPSTALARDHDREHERHELREWREHEWREHRHRHHFRAYFHYGHRNGYYNRWGYWHPYAAGYYDRWGNFHPYYY